MTGWLRKVLCSEAPFSIPSNVSISPKYFFLNDWLSWGFTAQSIHLGHVKLVFSNDCSKDNRKRLITLDLHARAQVYSQS